MHQGYLGQSRIFLGKGTHNSYFRCVLGNSMQFMIIPILKNILRAGLLGAYPTCLFFDRSAVCLPLAACLFSCRAVSDHDLDLTKRSTEPLILILSVI